MTIKTFPTLHVASCLTGIGLCEGMKFSHMHEIASHLFGTPIWLHELFHSPTQDAYVEEGYRQFPDMPTEAEATANLKAAAVKAVSAYGETVDVVEGTHSRREHPGDTAAAVMGDPNKVIVVNVREEP